MSGFMGRAPAEIQTLVDPWEAPWFCLIVGRVVVLDIMFRLTAAYPVVHDCFGTAPRMGMMGWWRRAKAADSSLQIVRAAAKKS